MRFNWNIRTIAANEMIGRYRLWEKVLGKKISAVTVNVSVIAWSQQTLS